MKPKRKSTKNGKSINETDSGQAQKRRELAREKRRQSALERLGTQTPRCPLCGETDWRVFDNHHVAGVAYDDFTARLCRNDHRKVSDSQKDHPQQKGEPPSLIEAVGHFLLGLADFFEELFKKLREFGEALLASIEDSGENTGVPA
jgi:hypothetical protein